MSDDRRDESRAISYAAVDAVLIDARETSWRMLAGVTAAVIIPLIVLCQYIAVLRDDVVDDQMFAYYGWRIADGATVYLDVWDNKPPGIYWINALAMFASGGSYAGVVAACSLALAISFVSFFIACASIYFRTAAALCTVLLSFYLMHGYYTGGTNRTETFLVAFELTAVALYMRGWARDRLWCWLAAGACAGCAFLFKQVGLAACAAMCAHLVLCALFRDISLTAAVRRAGLLVAGVALVLTLAAGVLAYQGALNDAIFATFTFNRSYFAAGHSRFPYSYKSWFLLWNDNILVMTLPYLLAVGALIHAALWRLRPTLRPRELDAQVRRLGPVCPRYAVFTVIWWGLAVYGALLSPHAFRHYLVPTFAPVIMLGGHLLSMLTTEQRLLRRMQQRAWVVATFVVMGWFAAEAVTRQWQSFASVWVPRVVLGQPRWWEEVGESVKRHSRPEDRIQCWGYMPGVYLHAKRVNVCRFTTTEKVGQVGPGARFVLDELERTLQASKPVLIVMEALDYEWIMGRRPDKPTSEVTIGPWMEANYVQVDDIVRHNILVFKRRDLADAP